MHFYCLQAFGVAVSGTFGLIVFWALALVPPLLHRGGILAYQRDYIAERMAVHVVVADAARDPMSP